MKNCKQFVFLGFLIIIVLINCGEDNDPSKQAKDQYIIITGLFDNNSSVVLKGFLTDQEWNVIPDKIKVALNENYNEYGSVVKGIYKDMFNNGIEIIIEKTIEYSKWKTTTDGKTMYINYNILDNELKLTIHSALQKIYSNIASIDGN